MSQIYDSVTQLIGRTPLMEPRRLAGEAGFAARLLMKLEGWNPAGSAKDRVALAMIRDAVERGALKPGGTIIEPTSGNTGIGLCALAAAQGYRCIIVMPDSMSRERQLLMKAYGAQLVLTPGAGGMAAAIAKAEQLHAQLPGSFLAGQFVNPANPQAHYQTTGPEIWEDCGGQVDLFVAGIGTGGTITGVGKYLREKNPQVEILGVEPADSPVLTQGRSGPHGIQGIGAGFVPEILDREILSGVIPVTTEEAFAASRLLGKTEGILAGISGGAALHVAMTLAKEEKNRGKTIVTLLPDSGERYLTTALYGQD